MPLRRKMRQAKARPVPFVGKTIINLGITAALIAGGRVAIDRLAQENTTTWLAAPIGNCVGTVFLDAHVVSPQENVELRVQSFEGDPSDVASQRENIVFDLSGKPIEVGGRVICFSEGHIAQKGLIFQATNTNEHGQAAGKEAIYNVAP